MGMMCNDPWNFHAGCTEEEVMLIKYVNILNLLLAATGVLNMIGIILVRWARSEKMGALISFNVPLLIICSVLQIVRYTVLWHGKLEGSWVAQMSFIVDGAFKTQISTGVILVASVILGSVRQQRKSSFVRLQIVAMAVIILTLVLLAVLGSIAPGSSTVTAANTIVAVFMIVAAAFILKSAWVLSKYTHGVSDSMLKSLSQRIHLGSVAFAICFVTSSICLIVRSAGFYFFLTLRMTFSYLLFFLLLVTPSNLWGLLHTCINIDNVWTISNWRSIVAPATNKPTQLQPHPQASYSYSYIYCRRLHE